MKKDQLQWDGGSA